MIRVQVAPEKLELRFSTRDGIELGAVEGWICRKLEGNERVDIEVIEDEDGCVVRPAHQIELGPLDSFAVIYEEA